MTAVFFLLGPIWKEITPQPAAPKQRSATLIHNSFAQTQALCLFSHCVECERAEFTTELQPRLGVGLPLFNHCCYLEGGDIFERSPSKKGQNNNELMLSTLAWQLCSCLNSDKPQCLHSLLGRSAHRPALFRTAQLHNEIVLILPNTQSAQPLTVQTALAEGPELGKVIYLFISTKTPRTSSQGSYDPYCQALSENANL